MDISSGFLVVGLIMTVAGAVLIYLSLRAGPYELNGDNDGVRYIGPIPIVVNGGRKWILTALIISSILLMYLITKSVYPDLLGGNV